MNIVMTGHKGLIGTYLKKRLEDEGHKIILSIDKKDGEDIDVLEDIVLEEKADLFIHAAAFCKINKTIEHPSLGHINAQHTYQVMEFCRKNKIPKIIYFSSSRILSKEKNPYTAGKIYGEELCKAYKDCYGIDYIIVRPSTVYAPVWDETRRVMHIFITNALQGKDLKIYGDPETKTLDFTYVTDFVDGVMLAMKNDWNKEYNISGGEEFNLYDLAKYIIEKTQSSSKIIVEEAEKAQPQKVSVDLREIKKIGYNPKISLKEGVLKTIEWYKKYLREHPEKIRKN